MQAMKQKIERIDLELLPEEARRKLVDFYEFLLNKYSINRKECESEHKKLSKFAGILKKVTIEPLEYQKELRSEWD